MNIHIQEDGSPRESEDDIHIWFSNIRIFGSYFGKFESKKHLRLKSWCQKSDPILDSKDSHVCFEFQEKKSIKEETILKLKEIIHILEDEGKNKNKNI